MNTLNHTRTSMAQDTFLNSAGLDSVRAMGRKKDPEALRQMAKQFEALFVQQMFKSMRAASDVFAKDSYLSNNNSKTYQQMLDQQLSLTMTKGRGIGLADSLYKQLMRTYGAKVAPGSVPPTLDNRAPDAAQIKPLGADTNTPVPASSGKKSSVPDPRHELSIAQQKLASTASKAQAPGHKDTPVSSNDFINSIAPYAHWAAQKLGVSVKPLLAQIALETGWGKAIAKDSNGNSSYNLFNIKADKNWQGDSVNLATTEFSQGEPVSVNAPFKRYNSVYQSFADYVNLMQKPRYDNARAAGTDSQAYADELQKSGYATDPAYAQKLKNIMAGFTARTTSLAAYTQHEGER